MLFHKYLYPNVIYLSIYKSILINYDEDFFDFQYLYNFVGQKLK